MPITAAYDLGEKLVLYRGVEPVQAVLCADPDRRWVQLARCTGSTWTRDDAVTDGPLEGEALGVTLGLEDVYAGLEV